MGDDADFDALINEFDGDAVSTAPVLPVAPRTEQAGRAPKIKPPPPSEFQIAKREEERARIAALRVERIAARKARNLAIAKECARRRAFSRAARPVIS